MTSLNIKFGTKNSFLFEVDQVDFQFLVKDVNVLSLYGKFIFHQILFTAFSFR